MGFDIKEFKKTCGGDFFRPCNFNVQLGESTIFQFLISKIDLNLNFDDMFKSEQHELSIYENEQFEAYKSLVELQKALASDKPQYMVVRFFSKAGEEICQISRKIESVISVLSLDWSKPETLASYKVTVITSKERV